MAFLTFAAFSELLLQQLGLCLTASIPFSQQLKFEILVAIRQIGYVFRVPNSQLCNLSLQLLQRQRSRHSRRRFSGRVLLDFLHCGYFVRYPSQLQTYVTSAASLSAQRINDLLKVVCVPTVRINSSEASCALAHESRNGVACRGHPCGSGLPVML